MATKLVYNNKKITALFFSFCYSLCVYSVVCPAADLNSALKSKQLSSALDPAAARIRLQVDYAVTMGWQTINYLTAYWAKLQYLPNESELLTFTTQLLQDNSDPFVKAVYYVPEQAIIVEMQAALPVETVLKNGLFIYRFDTLSWMFNPAVVRTTRASLTDAPTFTSQSISITPYFLDALHSMSIITDYCTSPQGYQALGGQMNDITWCPLWHDYVMPKQ